MQGRPAAKKRYALLDTLRGITLCSMIAYHACWDLVFLFGMPWAWYTGRAAFYWQQSICWTFIFLSGFCFPLGRGGLRRGAQVFLGGAAVTLTTLLFSYESRVIFGVLTFLGAAMLLTAVLRTLLDKLPPQAGVLLSAALFGTTRSINEGTLNLLVCKVELPAGLYRGWLETFFGFMKPDFYSSDYFSLLPWVFLFWCGYYTCRWLRARRADGRLPNAFCVGISPFSWLGRNSLLIYMLHQPLLFVLLTVWDKFR